ncbi:MAG: hypothetical protein EXR69_08015 [Myxococcales bacterium]|nr:hypothetical protein [Myxococcales bacterium]
MRFFPARPGLALSVATLCVAVCPLLAACAAPVADDSAPVAIDEPDDTDDDFTCETPEIHVNGNDPPVVGDYWEVLLWCDDTLLMGAMHMSIVPPDMATIEDYTMTFNLSGTGALSVQVGTIKATRDVVVSEAR